jgi:DNA-binding transcriptional MerR regulator
MALAMDIGDVAAKSGLPASTLRYYEEKGLINSVGRNGLRRLFDAGVLERLSLITLGRRAGFSLDEIGAMFTADSGLAIDRGRLLEKADDLDRTIRQLAAMRDGLRHAAECTAPSHLECLKFRRLVRLAGKGEGRRRLKSR